MSTGSTEADRKILVQLYQSSNGSNWKHRDGWDDNNLDLGSWFGVKTNDEGRVVQLNLKDNNLQGTIPSQLGGLSALKTLNLKSNKLSGTIPSQLGGLSALKTLNLAGNQLSGTIPSELGGLSALETLDLARNQLSGSIPSELGGLSALETLDLAVNQLSGSIPPELGLLGALETLDLAVNQLSGTIPPELGLLGALETLDLARNKLSGTIPPELGLLGALETLDLARNKLSGTIPSELGGLGALETLDLARNKLSGSIPSELGGLSALETLDLARNQLSGTIPSQLGGLSALETLDLAVNQLSVSSREDPEFDIGSRRKPKNVLEKRKTTYQTSQVEDDKVSDDEVAIPDEIQWPRIAEKATSNSWHGKGSSDFGNDNDVILAEGLGTQAMEFLDSSFGIELILEEKSLEKEIKKQVVMKPGVKFVTCDHERDTSRTHGELLEWSSKYNDGEKSDTSTFLVMPIVHGPSEVTFHPDRPAKLRYFVGKLGDLQDEIRGEGRGDFSRDAVAKHLREVYEPLISADGEKWRKLAPFQCIFKTLCNGATDVWLETRLYHFSEGAIGKLVDPSKLESNCRVYVDKRRWWQRYRGNHIIFGNLTEKVLRCYACKLHDAASTDRRLAGGLSAGPVGATADIQVGTSLQGNGLGDIVRYEVPVGRFQTIPLPKEGGIVHDQVLYAAFWCEEKPPEQPHPNQGAGSLFRPLLLRLRAHSPIFKRSQFFLQKDRAKKNMMVIVRQPMIDWCTNQEGTATTKKLDYDALLPQVKEFLLNH